MTPPLQVLYLEDDPTDAKLVQDTLESGGIECVIRCVEARGEFVATLEQGGVDLVLSDFSLPLFDGLSALEIVRTRWPYLPFVIVSGTLGEEKAIDALTSGATDYVLKNKLSRLVPAVRRAMREVSERAIRRELEAKLIDGQKMDVLGRLAAGVAHDFNNLIGVILGYSDLMLQGLAPTDRMFRFVGEIRHAAQRAVGLTRQLLVFSRKQTVQPAVLAFNSVLLDLDELLRRLIGEHIELKVIPGVQTGRILADAGYVGQVVMNLVVNARDAMPKGGRLIIATSNVTLDEAFARAHPGAAPGDYVLLSVSDTGTGMTDEVKAHIFEPLFSTKPKGQGTGLGLATCESIVRLSGGHIEVTTALGVGTTFSVYFPRVDQPPEIKATSVAPWPMARGKETVLIVEDEAAVRDLVRTVFEAQGYVVLSAANGQEGLRVVREHQGVPISLVITDLIMPVMGGKVMAEWLRATYPEIKILFTSGYSDDVINREDTLVVGADYLTKPYTTATLATRVRAILDGGAQNQHDTLTARQ